MPHVLTSGRSRSDDVLEHGAGAVELGPCGTRIDGGGGLADQRWEAPPRRSRDQTQATRGVNDRPQGQLARPVLLSVCCGLNLVRLSDSLFFAPQSDPEEKAKHHAKELREKRPNPGSFWFTAVGGSFFERHKTNFGVASLALEWQKWRTSSPYFVSLVRYSILVGI
jgi:hypothetical protein